MNMINRRLKRRLDILFRTIVIFLICFIIVLLFPKFTQHEYKKGMPWRYETLIAPFDFPIYKTEEERIKDREEITKEQVPIFNLNESTKVHQINKFVNAASSLKESPAAPAIEILVNELDTIYTKGIIQLPEKIDLDNVKYIKIVVNNIGQDVDAKQVYTLKKAYSTLLEKIDKLNLPQKVKEQLLRLNLNNYLQPNLEFDETKTNLDLLNLLKTPSLTQGMVQKGEVIISKQELVTPEKVKILNSLQIEYQHHRGYTTTTFKIAVGQIVLVLTALTLLSIFFYFSKKRIFYNNKEFVFLYGIFLATVALGSLSYYQNINILAIPVLFFTIVVNILIGSRSALYLLLSSTLLVSYFAPYSYEYMFMQISAGIVSIFSLSQLQRRGQLFVSAFLVFITYTLVYIAFVFIQEGTFQLSHLLDSFWLAVNCLLLTLTYPAIYIFERLFGYTSEITLMELSNPNHPALRALTQKAPGTFQHSFMVANLAEEAVYRIGGNSLLTRTGALYHDIGKTYDPIYFIENQTGGINPHDQCEYAESAQHIINHVSKGVELAHKYNLPENITNFIRTHHGKSKVKFFYNSFKNKYPDQKIDEAAFTYHGPDPITKEGAVVMMADAVEAASRALTSKTEENIIKLVNDIIDGQVRDGRFMNADITFKDIAVVKKVFAEMLANVYHSRIAYPKLKKE